ncbi:MAG: OB-fold nucleic acid binding domain-containing protein, partial [bacterium]|nr:OB-fold nucleic acid binding domain-containing protein [bacterium]
MAMQEEIRGIREAKLTRLEKAGMSPYPVSVKRTHTVQEALGEDSKLAKSAKLISIVGRIRAIRGHGGSTFLNVEDGTGSLQAYLKKDRVGAKAYDLFMDAFDLGDFVRLAGTMFKTKKGEKTLEVADFTMLTKSLLPLPDKWHGLQDVEERYRKRYLDLLFNKEVREVVVKR